MPISGQKAVLNGALHLSGLDGWWAEAYDGSHGFAIGDGESHVVDEIADKHDAESLYRVLENEVVPRYYERDADGLPHRWIAFIKNSLGSLAWRLSAAQIVELYDLRWQIELFFKELKSTLGFDQYRFQKFEKVERWIDLCLITVLFWRFFLTGFLGPRVLLR
jgi:glucan phosphorylase